MQIKTDYPLNPLFKVKPRTHLSFVKIEKRWHVVFEEQGKKKGVLKEIPVKHVVSIK